MKIRLFMAVVIAGAGVVGAMSRADHGEDERVEELMEKTHEGRRSPYRQAKQQAEAAVPSWRAIEALVPRFEEMSRALRESKNQEISGSADGYVDAVTELATAARKRDAREFKQAVSSLGESCGDCHFKGGVGGEL